MAESWSALDDTFAEEQENHEQASLLQAELDNIDSMLHEMVVKNKKAMDFLFTKYVIDAPIYTEIPDIYRAQGKIELLRWIYMRAEATQIKSNQIKGQENDAQEK